MRTITIEQTTNGYVVSVTDRHVLREPSEVAVFVQNAMDDEPYDASVMERAAAAEVPASVLPGNIHQGINGGWPVPVRGSALPPAPVPLNEGFITYTGGGCPAPAGAIVAINSRDGTEQGLLFRVEEVNWERVKSYKILPMQAG
jgi:hypothetical protein